MQPKPGPAVTFLLRIWRNGTHASAHWRVSLEDPHTGARHGFADLAAAIAFLEAQLAAVEQCSPHSEFGI